MKKIVIASSLLLLFVSGCSMNGANKTVEGNNKSPQKAQTTKIDEKVTDDRSIISFHGKYSSLASDLDELESTSPIVVEVIKNDEEQTVKKESDKNTLPTEFYTLSGVTITEIQKDESSTLKEGDKIKVLEDVATNVLIEGKARTLTVDNYKKMETGKSYYLYLRDSTSGDNYVLTNAFLSKYPTKEEPKSKLFLAESNLTENIEETNHQDLYEDLYTEILHGNE
ncbi:hypothetical protein HB943_10335 [Listeria weihenstephanensis]|uniref:Lipoprotein n=1 Tax=Listeria weihenstephanensis TaxID=1006155 RepID=A0A841Z6U2_9LIST|nr:hypothetical protein [Listeria weihenstephanensis]MBC1501005.1 hypothetical protein [Listeria weihenstephanensis]